jgi:hypothetical protein
VPLQVSLLVGLCSLRGNNLLHHGSQANLHIMTCMDATGLSPDAGANFESRALFTVPLLHLCNACFVWCMYYSQCSMQCTHDMVLADGDF